MAEGLSVEKGCRTYRCDWQEALEREKNLTWGKEGKKLVHLSQYSAIKCRLLQRVYGGVKQYAAPNRVTSPGGYEHYFAYLLGKLRR